MREGIRHFLLLWWKITVALAIPLGFLKGFLGFVLTREVFYIWGGKVAKREMEIVRVNWDGSRDFLYWTLKSIFCWFFIAVDCVGMVLNSSITRGHNLLHARNILKSSFPEETTLCSEWTVQHVHTQWSIVKSYFYHFEIKIGIIM